MTTPLEYLSPNCGLTLSEGIAELRKAEGADADASECMAPEFLDDIDIHDAIHVLCACPTSLRGEIIVHVWTIFGTTVRIRDMHRVNEHDDHREVLAQIGHRKLIATWLRSFPKIIVTFLNAMRMRSKLPIEQIQQWMDRPLVELRRKYGIRLTKFAEQSGRGGGTALRSARRDCNPSVPDFSPDTQP